MSSGVKGVQGLHRFFEPSLPALGRRLVFLGIREVKGRFMSNKTTSISLARGGIPSEEVEVVDELESRLIEQTSSKARVPEEFFKESHRGSPGFSGAEVDTEEFAGFLAAAQTITEHLTSVKITYRGSDRLYVEVSSNGLWGLVAIKSEQNPGVEFEEVISLKRIASIAKRATLRHRRIIIGVLREMMSIGPVMIPIIGKRDFPPAPALRDWESRATIPANYFKEILQRVTPAQSEGIETPSLRAVLLDHSVAKIEGEHRVLCTAIATDGVRLHALKLPGMLTVQTKTSRIPPSVVLPERYFKYLSAVANRQWTGLEFSEGQVLARGKDYIAVAKTTMRGSSYRSIEDWKDIYVEYDGYWAVDKSEFSRIINGAASFKLDGISEIRLGVDSIQDVLNISLIPSNSLASELKDSISAKRFNGPPTTNATVKIKHLVEAVSACNGGLIRLGFSSDVSNQSSSAITVQGEDELFRAVIMPVTRGVT